MAYRVAADMVLIVHVAFIAFVVLGLLLTLVGGVFGWGWVRQPWFRLVHLMAIGVVVVQAWLGVMCPLTVWESRLRQAAGQPVYEQGFIADWLQPVIFFDAEPWVFTLAYSVFGALVVLSFWLVPVRWAGRKAHRSTGLLTR